jgi:hypothetical protein
VYTEEQQVAQDTGDLVEHHADVLGAHRYVDAEQALHRHAVGVLVQHDGEVVHPVHVGQGLDVGPGLGQFLRRAMQHADVRVRVLHHLAVHFQYQAQHAVRRRMLRPEVHRVIANFGHISACPDRRTGLRG